MIDGKRPDTALGAAQFADQPLATAASRVGESGIDDLYQLLIAGRKDRHAKRIAQLRMGSFASFSRQKIWKPVEKLEKQIPHRLKSVRDDKKSKGLATA